MCGIAGFTQYHQNFGDIKNLKTMGDAIRHRGPDASGTYIEQNIGLCHRRLSIIDLSELGNQPLISHDENYVISYNGEIYNYLELRKQLVDDGYPFKTQTDTEVLLALYARDGKDCLEKINGMFAFAIWNKNKQTLFLARDRIGKKPLYYYTNNTDVVFASELKSILTQQAVPREIRLDAVYDFFAYQYIPDPKTIFQNIYKLEPGHYLEVSAEGIKKEKYWDISFKQQSKLPETDLKKQLHQLIKEGTASRMISDVPLGAFLSGGIDSSAIVATMANISEQPITTCAIGFNEKEFNETEFAKIVADQYQTHHHELTVHKNVREYLVHIVSFFDEPFADPSLVPTYFVSELARKKVTVAISGDGGDEIFAGYEKYTTDYIENRLRNLFPKFFRSSIFPMLESIFSRLDHRIFRKAVTLLNSLKQEQDMGFYLSNSQITDRVWEKIILDKTRNNLGHYHPSSITTTYYQNSDAPDHLSKILYTDMKTYLPGDILVKVDRMSMANSLEVRAPILDYHLIEFASTIPSDLKYHKGEKKYLLKETVKQDLPKSILNRKKMGFSVPLAKWLRTEIRELTEETLFKSKAGLRDYFKMDIILQFWEEHQSGEKDHSTVLWSFLMFQIWWNEYMS